MLFLDNKIYIMGVAYIVIYTHVHRLKRSKSNALQTSTSMRHAERESAEYGGLSLKKVHSTINLRHVAVQTPDVRVFHLRPILTVSIVMQNTFATCALTDGRA